MAINKGKILQNAQKYVLQGKYELAIEEYKKIVQDNPKDWNTFIQIGNLYLKIGKNSEAINNLKKVADYYYQDGQHVKAIALYKQINRIDPALEDISLKLADLFIKQGLIMEAKSQLIVLGEHFTKKGQINQAAEVFKKLIELEPDNLKAKIELAKIYKSLGDINSAIKEYLAVSEEYAQQNLIAESLKILEGALELQPSNPELLKKIVATYNKSGNPQKAIELLEKLIGSKKATADTYMQLAASYFHSKNYQKTEAILKKCIEMDELYIPAYDSLVQLLISNNKLSEAFELVDRLSLKLIQKQEDEKAIPFLRQVLDIAPNRSDFAERLADIYVSLHQENNAIGILNNLLESLISEKRYNEAEIILRKLMKYEPDNIQYQEKLRLIVSYIRPSAKIADKEAGRGKEEKVKKVEDMKVAEKVIEKEELEESKKDLKQVTFDKRQFKEEKIEEKVSEEEIEIEIEMPEEEVPKVEAIEEELTTRKLEEDGTFEKEEVVIPDVKEQAKADIESEEHYNQLEIDEMHEFIREHMIEAEVFSKYGLIDKAIEKLGMIINRFPLAIEAYLKLKDIYLLLNNREGAVEQYIKLIQIFKEKGDKVRVNEFIQEAKRIAPTHRALSALSSEKPKTDAFSEVQMLEELYASRKAAKEKVKKDAIRNLNDLELEIDITRDIEDIASIKEMMEAETIEEKSKEIKEEEEDRNESKAMEEFIKEIIVDKDKEAGEIDKDIVSKEEKIEETVAQEKIEKIKEEIIEEFQEIELPIGISEEEEQKEKKLNDFGFEVEKPAELSFEKGFDDSIAELNIENLPEVEEEETAATAEEVYDSQFSESILKSIDERLEHGDYDGAEDIIQEACSLYGDLPFLVRKQQEINLAKSKEVGIEEGIKEEIKEEKQEMFGELGEEGNIDTITKEHIEEEEIRKDIIAKEAEEEKQAVTEESFVVEEEESVDFSVGLTEEELEEEAFKDIEYKKKDEASSTSEMEIKEIFSSVEEKKGEMVIGGIEEEEASVQEEESVEEDMSSVFEEEENFFDLASELEKEILNVTTTGGAESLEPTHQVSLEEVFSEFKKGVEKQIDSHDYETRYNLGVAYKEMGLLDDAIAEFQMASKDEKRFLECCSLLGLCFIEKGLPKLAIKWYEKGLAAPGYSEDEYQSIKYELAQTYEMLGEWQKAYEIYLEVYANNANYRDVSLKIKELESVIQKSK